MNELTNAQENERRLSTITSLLLLLNEYNNIQYIYTHNVHVRKYIQILGYASISYVPSTQNVQLIQSHFQLITEGVSVISSSGNIAAHPVWKRHN